MRRTIIVKTVDGLDRNGLNDLLDVLQGVKGVHSVSLPSLEPSPDQMTLWPDDPAEQKLFAGEPLAVDDAAAVRLWEKATAPTHEQKMAAVRARL